MEENRKWIEEQIAMQCAPLFAGLKPSNLLIVPENLKAEVNQLLSESGYSGYLLSSQNGKRIYLLYQQNQLVVYLARAEVRSFLRELGYETCYWKDLISQVAKQYTSHLENQAPFPHELGILLGYPVVDVRGFMEQNGKNFLYAGYWKVYGNLKETLCLFQEFHAARTFFVERVMAGDSILQAAQVYRRSRQMQQAIS